MRGACLLRNLVFKNLKNKDLHHPWRFALGLVGIQARFGNSRHFLFSASFLKNGEPRNTAFGFHSCLDGLTLPFNPHFVTAQVNKNKGVKAANAHPRI